MIRLKRSSSACTRVFLSATVATAMVLGVTAGAGAQQTLRLTHNVSDETTWHEGAERFKELVAERTDGEMEIRLHPNAELSGGDQIRMVEMVGRGQLDFALTSAINATPMMEEMAVFSLPYIYEDYDDVDATLEGPPAERMAEIMRDEGLVTLAWGENGFRQITNSQRPIRTPSDLEGLTIRVAGPMYIDVMEDLGANPEQMQWTEVFSALQQGVVDGQENPIGAIIVPQRIYEVQDYITVWNYSYDPLFLAVSEQLWNSLDTETQEILQGAAEEAMEHQVAISRERTAEGLDRLREEGMEVTELSAEEIDAFRAATRDSYNTWRERVGPELVDLFEETVEENRQ